MTTFKLRILDRLIDEHEHLCDQTCSIENLSLATKSKAQVKTY